MSKLLIKNIKGLVGAFENTPSVQTGKEMDRFPVIENAFLAIENDRIVAFGNMDDWGGITDWRDLQVIDAEGRFVFPSYCDSHTHVVFAGSRETEFEDRIAGLSYEEIATKGGGILNSAARLASATEEELYEAAKTRIKELIKLGTGALEIKSGYGLSVESELKMLRVIKRLKAELPIPIKATFLGAHAIPKAYKENRSAYIDLIINDMLPKIAEENLADYVDVFCEKNYFTTTEMDAILKAASLSGLLPKVHVNQFNAIGGIATAIKHKAVSVDHLEVLNDEDIDLLKSHKHTMATFLPSCSFFIDLPYGPARTLQKHEIPFALASDYNPGSTPSGNMNFVVSLACIHQKISPQAAFCASTLHGAYAMQIQDNYGSINVGKKANVFITKPMPSLAYLPYHFANNLVDCVILNGKIINQETTTLLS